MTLLFPDLVSRRFRTRRRSRLLRPMFRPTPIRHLILVGKLLSLVVLVLLLLGNMAIAIIALIMMVTTILPVVNHPASLEMEMETVMVMMEVTSVDMVTHLSVVLVVVRLDPVRLDPEVHPAAVVAVVMAEVVVMVVPVHLGPTGHLRPNNS